MNEYRKVLSDKEYQKILDDNNSNIEIEDLVYSPGNVLYNTDIDAFNELKSNYDNSPWVCGECNSEHESQEHAKNCCKIGYLAKLLGQAGYSGLDADLKISLLEYQLVYNDKTGHYISCYNPDLLDELEDDLSILFDAGYIDRDDILDALKELNDGFFDFIGTNRADYTTLLTKDSTNLVLIISDINSYNWFGVGASYDSTLDNIINTLEQGADNDKNK